MCRRNVLHGCCLVCFGIGLMMGHYFQNWLLCAAGGLGLVALGFVVLKRR